MDDLIQRLDLSKGSASQGLRFLRQIGAIKPVYVAGDRRDHYEAEMELRNLIVGFLKEKMAPHFEHGPSRLDQMEIFLKDVPRLERAHVASRVETLRRWEKTGRKLVPLVVKLLGH
jgi:DNA-binding transcriptional regulator GbsR (MarR family)